MIDIRRLTAVTQDMLEQIVPGYTSDRAYIVERSKSLAQVSFILRCEPLRTPFVKRHDYFDPSILAHYNDVAAKGHSYGAHSDAQCVALVLAELQRWNSTLVVREFGVRPEYRRRGIGKSLLERVIEDARAADARCVLCETQNCNVPAIEFYQSLGFGIEGIDTSFYRNDDTERNEVAVFLRKKL